MPRAAAPKVYACVRALSSFLKTVLHCGGTGHFVGNINKKQKRIQTLSSKRVAKQKTPTDRIVDHNVHTAQGSTQHNAARHNTIEHTSGSKGDRQDRIKSAAYVIFLRLGEGRLWPGVVAVVDWSCSHWLLHQTVPYRKSQSRITVDCSRCSDRREKDPLQW